MSELGGEDLLDVILVAGGSLSVYRGLQRGDRVGANLGMFCILLVVTTRMGWGKMADDPRSVLAQLWADDWFRQWVMWMILGIVSISLTVLALWSVGIS